MSVIIHAMGPTCAGKSTIINALVDAAPENVEAVQIGKALRAKYGEAYFQGQAAPEKTRQEAIDMYRSLISESLERGTEIIIIDGQPRDVEQAEEMLNSWKSHRNVFLLIHAGHNIREERARAGRKPGPDLELAVARLTNDYKNNYDVMTHLLKNNVQIDVIDTGEDGFNVGECVRRILEQYSDEF